MELDRMNLRYYFVEILINYAYFWKSLNLILRRTINFANNTMRVQDLQLFETMNNSM